MMKYIYFLIAMVLYSTAALAEDDKGTFNVQFENDIFNGGTDRHYTNGVRFSYLSPEKDIPEPILAFGQAMPFFSKTGDLRYSVALGQSMFTPENIATRTPNPNDRPYAAWLYGSVGLVSETESRIDNLELSLGMVGPSAQGEGTQKFVHDLIGATNPQGWDHQLKDEPGFILLYQRKYRAYYATTEKGYGFDFTPHFGGAIGNIDTHAGIGGTIRFGQDLPSDYGPPLINPSVPGTGYFEPEKDFGWYLFAGTEGRAVGRNIFLDGNTFRDSPSVDKEWFVADFQAGAAITFDNTRIAYTHVFRTEEFKTQRRPDIYGSLSVSYRF